MAARSQSASAAGGRGAGQYPADLRFRQGSQFRGGSRRGPSSTEMYTGTDGERYYQQDFSKFVAGLQKIYRDDPNFRRLVETTPAGDLQRVLFENPRYGWISNAALGAKAARRLYRAPGLTGEQRNAIATCGLRRGNSPQDLAAEREACNRAVQVVSQFHPRWQEYGAPAVRRRSQSNRRRSECGNYRTEDECNANPICNFSPYRPFTQCRTNPLAGTRSNNLAQCGGLDADACANEEGCGYSQRRGCFRQNRGTSNRQPRQRLSREQLLQQEIAGAWSPANVQILRGDYDTYLQNARAGGWLQQQLGSRGGGGGGAGFGGQSPPYGAGTAPTRPNARAPSRNTAKAQPAPFLQESPVGFPTGQRQGQGAGGAFTQTAFSQPTKPAARNAASTAGWDVGSFYPGQQPPLGYVTAGFR